MKHENPYKQSTSRGRIISGLMFGNIIAALDLLIIATAIPDITSDLGSVTQATWVFTAYLLGNSVAMLIWGKMGDIYGRGRIYSIVLLMFMVSSLAAGLSVSMLMLVVARLVQGVAAGGLLSLSYGIVADITPERGRGFSFSFLSAIWAIAAVLGPFVGSALLESLGWRWIFYINLPIGAVAILLIAPLINLRPKEKGRFLDLRGAMNLILGLTLIIIAISFYGEYWSLGSPAFLFCMVMGVLIMTLFILNEMKSKEPIIPIRMLKHRAVFSTSLTNFSFGLANFGAVIAIPIYAQIVNNATPLWAGLSLSPVAVGIFITSFVVGWVIKKTGRYRLYPSFGALIYMVAVVMLISISPETSRGIAMLAALIAGVGNGMIQPVAILSIQKAVPARDLGAATSLATSSRTIGQTVGSALFGAILTSRLNSRLSDIGSADAETYLENPDEINDLAPSLKDRVVEAFEGGFDDSYRFLFIYLAITVAAGLLIPHKKLSETI